jgi:hypothetical protein
MRSLHFSVLPSGKIDRAVVVALWRNACEEGHVSFHATMDARDARDFAASLVKAAEEAEQRMLATVALPPLPGERP